jgi:predicted anti-sigma-YlaC factor YlaD
MFWKWIRLGKMMRCQEVVDLLSDYLDDELSETEVADIRKHLAGCANCETFFDSLKTTVRLTKKLECEEIPPAVIDRLQSFVKERIR